MSEAGMGTPVTPVAGSAKSKPLPPFLLIVENPDGEVVLGEDVSRAPVVVVSDQAANQQASNYDVERETIRAEREADRRGLMGMVIRRRRAAAFMLCLDVMYMFLTATLFVRDGPLDAKEVVTLVLVVLTALADFFCVMWLVSSNASVAIFTLASWGQVVCMGWTVGLLTRGSTAFLVIIRACALLQILRARAAVVELIRLGDLPRRLPPAPTLCERVHYFFVGRAHPFYNGPRRERRAPRSAPAPPAAARPVELTAVVAHETTQEGAVPPAAVRPVELAAVVAHETPQEGVAPPGAPLEAPSDAGASAATGDNPSSVDPSRSAQGAVSAGQARSTPDAAASG